MHNDKSSAKPPLTNPSPPAWVSAKEAGECLLGSLSAADRHDPPVDSLYIFSTHHSVEKYQHAPEFAVVRQYIPLEVATEYAGDVDSVYALLEDVFEHDDEEMRFGKAGNIPETVRDEISLQLHTWSAEIFSRELAPQAQALGYVFHRDMLGGFLMSGNRLMCVGPASGSAA